MAGKDKILQNSDEVSITFEDQQKINKYARLNAKMDDTKEELKNRHNDLKNLEEACDELALMDEEADNVPYLFGEVFICQSVGETLKRLEDAKVKKNEEITELDSQIVTIKSEMAELKVHLYGRFSNHINLEVDED